MTHKQIDRVVLDEELLSMLWYLRTKYGFVLYAEWRAECG